MAARKYEETEIETVMTFKEWEKLHYQQLEEWKEEKFYYVKQKAVGFIMATIGIFTPFLSDCDATFSLIALPLGLFLVLTKEKVMMF